MSGRKPGRRGPGGGLECPGGGEAGGLGARETAAW